MDDQLAHCDVEIPPAGFESSRKCQLVSDFAFDIDNNSIRSYGAKDRARQAGRAALAHHIASVANDLFVFLLRAARPIMQLQIRCTSTESTSTRSILTTLVMSFRLSGSRSWKSRLATSGPHRLNNLHPRLKEQVNRWRPI